MANQGGTAPSRPAWLEKNSDQIVPLAVLAGLLLLLVGVYWNSLDCAARCGFGIIPSTRTAGWFRFSP